MPKFSGQFDLTRTPEPRRLEHVLLTNTLLHSAVTWLGWTALTMMVWPRFVAPFRLQVRELTLTLPKLHPEFAGYRIVFLSDLHVGRTHQAYLRRTVEAVAQLKPDLVLLGGDLIDYHPRSLPLLAELLPLLGQVGASDGVLAIFGNHDYHEYSWRHIGPRSAHRAVQKRLVRLLEESPVRLLRNEMVRLTRAAGKNPGNRGGLQIVGMDELWCGGFNPRRAFAAVDAAEPVICLQHNPDGFEHLAEYPWDAMLCGHSHGGQVDVPIVGPIYVPMIHRHYLRGFLGMARPGQRQVPRPPATERQAGRSGREGERSVGEAGGKAGGVAGGVAGRPLFVSTGVGYSKPLRFRVPPEVVLFTLRPASAGVV